MRILFIILFLMPVCLICQDTFYLKVHFLYGSKPTRKYSETEDNWFGGIHGGHVGIEAEDGNILSFSPEGRFHVFAHRRSRHSGFSALSQENFWSIMGSPQDSVQKLSIYVPISLKQKKRFDSLYSSYLNATPYDYAFIGMRCASSSYEILAQLGILKTYGTGRTKMIIFYPKKLRKRLIKAASSQGWTMLKAKGSARRKWEKD